MIIFKDIITGDELFTDSNKLELIDDCLYEVACNKVTRNEGGFVLDGANPSAEGEDADDGADDSAVQTGLDIILNQNLNETDFNKASYKTYLKTYTKALQDKWKEQELSPEQLDEYKNKFMAAVKLVLPKLDNVAFYMGQSFNPDGMVPLLEYKDMPDGTQKPFMYFFKHGLESEKC